MKTQVIESRYIVGQTIERLITIDDLLVTFLENDTYFVTQTYDDNAGDGAYMRLVKDFDILDSYLKFRINIMTNHEQVVYLKEQEVLEAESTEKAERAMLKRLKAKYEESTDDGQIGKATTTIA